MKAKPYRNRKYLKWVKSNPCVSDPLLADYAHHIIGHGVGGMGTTASDLFSFPLSRFWHTKLHHDPKKWEEWHGNQWLYVIKTLNRAIDAEVITKGEVMFEIAQVKNQDDRHILLEGLIKV